MFVRLQPSSPVPVYRQITDQISYQIAAGTLRPGDKLPSVRDLAKQLPANQNTVLKAYDLLARDGLLQRKQGNGTFVTATAPALKKSQRIKLIADALTGAATLAVHLDISRHEMHDLLDKQIDLLEKGAGRHV